MESRPPLQLGVVAIKKGAFGSPSTKVANFTFTELITVAVAYIISFKSVKFGLKSFRSSKAYFANFSYIKLFLSFFNILEVLCLLYRYLLLDISFHRFLSYFLYRLGFLFKVDDSLICCIHCL